LEISNLSQYLVICETLLPAPPAVIDAFIAQCEYMNELIKKGSIKMFVPFTAITGGFFVADVPSNEDLSKIISGCPMFPYVSRKIYPLSDDDVVKQIMKDMKQKMS
jgi:muconolactone delta-isomerase